MIDMPPAKVKRSTGHKHFHADYINGECLRCRNNRRWKEYRENVYPVFTKKIGGVRHAGFVRDGRTFRERSLA